MNNIRVVRRMVVGNSNKAQSSWKRNVSSLPPPLEKYERTGDDTMDGIVIVDPPPLSDVPVYSSYHSVDLINEQVRELQVCVSSVSIKKQHFFSLETLFFHNSVCSCLVVSATRLCSNGDRDGKIET